MLCAEAHAPFFGATARLRRGDKSYGLKTKCDGALTAEAGGSTVRDNLDCLRWCMRLEYSALLLVLACCACSRQGDPVVPQAERGAVEHAVGVWRDRYDPVWQYAHAHCGAETSASASFGMDLKRRVKQVLHTSTANACDRLHDAPESNIIAVNGDSAIVIVHSADARPASALQFSLARASGNWVVQKVAAAEADTLATI
jgi:hypothetical protein